MHRTRIVSTITAILLVAAGVGEAAITHTRSASFARRASVLQATWDRDAADGLPSDALAPLRAELARSPRRSTAWWSPSWVTDPGMALLGDLERRTDAAWRTSMATARSRAEAEIATAKTLAATDGQFLPAATLAGFREWPGMLGKARTPATTGALAAGWRNALESARDAAATQRINAAVSGAGGPGALVAAAGAEVAVAERDDLDPGDVAALAAAVEARTTTGQDAVAATHDLFSALQQLRQLISLNDETARGIGPLGYTVAQAVAEQAPESAAVLAGMSGLQSAFHDARTLPEMTAVAQRMASLTTEVTRNLTAARCGHPVGDGRVITLNLTVQEAVFYQDGCVVKAAPITTGRPGLRTPAGTFRVFYKTTPFVMHSPWPRGSPYWYPDSPVSWVMEFLGGGYFLHDAPWEAPSQYGAGSEDTGAASHGCVHIPTDVMEWLYGWTPVGTPVIVT